MAMNRTWFDMFVKDTVKPRYSKIRRMDRDDWLAQMGLERRNPAGDVAGAFGLVLLGCGIGIAAGLLLAKKPGNDFRREMTQRIRDTAGKVGERMRPEQTTSGVSPTLPSQYS